LNIALFSDLHGNLQALDAFQEYLREHPADQVIFLGDAAVNGPQPHECVDRLHRWGIPMVMGNTDQWALHPVPREFPDEDARLRYAIETWSAGQLTPADLETIRTFQNEIEVPLPGGRSLYCCHGAPGSFANISSQTTHDELLRLLAPVPHSAVVACGHTHAPLLRQVGKQMLVNSGSLGRPLVYTPQGGRIGTWADFVVIEANEAALQFSFQRIGYNQTAFFDTIQHSELPHKEYFLASYLQ
jgi:putative phosphoesterase